MNLAVSQLVTLIIILVLIIVIGRYIWGVYFRDHIPKEWLHAVRTGKVDPGLVRMKWAFPDKPRFYSWWFQVERLKRDGVPGAFAELGVYKGESARVIHRMDPARTFHLFDTFSGFPPKDMPVESGKAQAYTPADFADTTPERVIRRIKGNENVILHPGYFPDTTHDVEHEIFALVNIDADLYYPTICGLRFFYSRLSKGGVIFIHDYNHDWEGLMKAVDEFSATVPECFVQVPDIDSTVMLIRNK